MMQGRELLFPPLRYLIEAKHYAARILFYRPDGLY